MTTPAHYRCSLLKALKGNWAFSFASVYSFVSNVPGRGGNAGRQAPRSFNSDQAIWYEDKLRQLVSRRKRACAPDQSTLMQASTLRPYRICSCKYAGYR
eukprot:6178614-Pleurochrysis_carterae.AAC.5